MTTDDLISMHKACEAVITEVMTVDGATCRCECLPAIQTALQSVKNLAVVQRDLLATMLTPTQDPR